MVMQYAVTGIKQILKDTNELHGWTIPEYIVDYEARILADKVDQPCWQPKPSYAERYLHLRTARETLEFGNICWFTRSCFPSLQGKIVKPNYYTQLGQRCYDTVLRSTSVPSPTIRIMRDHFEFLAETTYTAIRHFGDFRSMWD
jgi:hypothetical protein